MMAEALASGSIIQVMGPAIDVAFPAGQLPGIHTALLTTNPSLSGGEDNLVLEVAQHLGEDTVRAVAMDSTDCIARGAVVKNTGSPISMPVGPEILGRILNVVGQPVDDIGPVNTQKRLPIHREPPSYT